MFFSQLSQKACDVYHVEAFFGVWEHFYSYQVEDSFLKTRNIWP